MKITSNSAINNLFFLETIGNNIDNFNAKHRAETIFFITEAKLEQKRELTV